MLKKIGMMVASICLAFSCMGEMSETQRITIDGIEWLYTVDFETKSLVLEKAILLTADRYDMEINFQGIIDQIFPYDSNWPHWPSEKNYIWNISFGSKCFANNDELTSVSLLFWGMCADAKFYLTFCDGSFKNCVELTSIGYSSDAENVFVVSIEDSAFEECNSSWLKEENGVMPSFNFGFEMSTVTNIGSRAFYNCHGQFGSYGICNLDSIVHIGEDAFAHTELGWSTGLAGIGSMWKEIRLPVTYKNIEKAAFRNYCGKVVIPKGVETIGDYAFAYCVFTSAPARLGDDVYDKSYLMELIIPEGVVSIGECAFEGAVYTGLKLPNTLVNISAGAFAVGIGPLGGPLSSYLKGSITIPGSVVSDVNISRHNQLEKIVLEVGYTNTLLHITDCKNLKELILPNTINALQANMFRDCPNLKVIIPSSIILVGKGDKLAEWPTHIIFEGLPPSKVLESMYLTAKDVWVPIEYKSQWAPYFRPNMKFAKKVDGEWVAIGGKVISNAMRPSDPTIMDIKYKVTSTKDKVNVRILAFEDGNRSFAKVLRPETFVDGTEANVGDGVAANEEHTISWQVSKDWNVDLAKVSIEVYVREDNLLPLQLTTIPAMGERAAVAFSRNVPDRDKVMNALYWLYADKATDLTLANGVLKCGNTQLVNGSTLSDANAVSYIYSKMGYGTLSGDTLKYVNELMRTNLNPSGLTQYAVKEDAAQ